MTVEKEYNEIGSRLREINPELQAAMIDFTIGCLRRFGLKQLPPEEVNHRSFQLGVAYGKELLDNQGMGGSNDYEEIVLGQDIYDEIEGKT